MIAAPSPEEREGAERAQSAAGPSQKTRGNPQLWIVSGPLSVGTLVFWGVVIFAAGFFHGRQMRDVGEEFASPSASQASPVPAVSSGIARAAPSPSASAEATPARVTIRMLKFSPAKIEIKPGDVVEWANADLTPHTATSQDAQEINSGAINAGASWRHTFGKSGTFPYYCTFHPEMKGVVVVQ